MGIKGKLRDKKSSKEKSPETIELFKIETGIKLPKSRKKDGVITKAIRKSLEDLPVDGSFPIKKNQESIVRRLIKDEVKFKSYNVTIRSIEGFPDYKRVFRLVKK